MAPALGAKAVFLVRSVVSSRSTASSAFDSSTCRCERVRTPFARTRTPAGERASRAARTPGQRRACRGRAAAGGSSVGSGVSGLLCCQVCTRPRWLTGAADACDTPPIPSSTRACACAVCLKVRIRRLFGRGYAGGWGGARARARMGAPHARGDAGLFVRPSPRHSIPSLTRWSLLLAAARAPRQ